MHYLYIYIYITASFAAIIYIDIMLQVYLYYLYIILLYPSVYNSSHSCQPAGGLKPDVDLLTGAAIKRVGEVERNCTVHTYTRIHTVVQCCVFDLINYWQYKLRWTGFFLSLFVLLTRYVVAFFLIILQCSFFLPSSFLSYTQVQ